jgi:hypothetical protein
MACPLDVALSAPVCLGPPPLASGGLRHAGCYRAQFSDYCGIVQWPGRPATPVIDLLSNIGKSSYPGERVVVFESEDRALLAKTAEQIRRRQRRDPLADLPRLNPCQPGA